MSAENNQVCCNCRHCIRSHDEKYDITVCRCEKYDRYLSYAEVMSGCCGHWSKEKSESRKQANIGVLVAEGLKRGIQEGIQEGIYIKGRKKRRRTSDAD